MSYVPVGTGGTAGAWEFISTVTISTDATIDIDLTGTHKMYVVHLDEVVSAVDDRELWLRFSTDAGSTFLSGASDYGWSNRGVVTATVSDEAIDDKIMLTRTGVADASLSANLSGFIYIHNANQTTNAVNVTCDMVYMSGVSELVGIDVRGGLIANLDEVDSIRFLLEASANLATGRISLYGVNDAA